MIPGYDLTRGDGSFKPELGSYRNYKSGKA
jgi:hypothetical protein